MRTLFIIFICIILTMVAIKIGKEFFIKNSNLAQLTNNLNWQESQHNLSATASNQWYSNIYKNFPSQPLYIFPQTVQLTPDGIGVSLPVVTKEKNSISAPFDTDFTLQFDSGFFRQPEITSIGDWSVGIHMETTNDKIAEFTLTKGSPFIYFNFSNAPININFARDFRVYNNGLTQIKESDMQTTTSAFLLEIKDKYYLVKMSQPSTISLTDRTIHLENPHDITIAALDTKDHFQLFLDNSSATITGTVVSWESDGKNAFSNYIFNSNGKKPLVVIFPHQYDFLEKTIDTLGTYTTIRGEAHLVKTNSFTVRYPLLTPDTNFHPLEYEPNEFISTLQEDIKTYLQSPPPDSQDYFLGTWLGKGTTLLQLSYTNGLNEESKQMQDFLEKKLTDALKNFSYDNTKTSVIADRPEFGNENLNDHHFHWGYYIRTAAVLSSMDPSYQKTVEQKINELVEDIANTDRNSRRFPFLRNFDVYEGHSWADGFANFADGNNQESSSEAINAWYSVYLWAKVTDNKELEQTALYLYNTEIQSTKYYWFGKNGMYSAPYEHAIASIVWGGKVDYSTWFSDKTNMKYGIQILPITPGSFGYLGTFDNFETYENHFYSHGGDITDEWGDLFVAFTSFYNPDKALALKDQVTKPETNNPKSLFLYTLYHNLETRGENTK